MSRPSFASLVHMQEWACTQFATRELFGTKTKGQYVWSTYGEFGAQINAARAGLAGLGIGAGDTVAIIAANRTEWAVAAYATYGLAAKYAPMYEAQLPKEWQFIIDDSDAKVVIASTAAIRDAVVGLKDQLPKVTHIICLEGDGEGSWAALLAAGKAAPVPSVHPSADDVAGLIYTSGTTGKPKGVVLSHGNFISNVNGVQSLLPITDGDRSCSFLPWAHSFGQTCELHIMISKGAAVGLAESVATLIDNFGEVRPTVLFAVPRIFNKIYDGLQKRMEGEKPIKRKLFHAGLAVARRRRALRATGGSSAWLDFQYNLFDKLVFSKVKARFGGQLRYAVSGGAALSKEVGEFIDDIGIVVCEGYGLTETSPICTVNTPVARQLGSIGKPIPDVSVFICDDAQNVLPPGQDGELVVVGPNVMQGYHNHPEETAAVIFQLNGQRAFRTGDKAVMQPDGFYRITGRFKEQYKLENGKYVVPTPLEDQLKLSGFITQAFIFGDNKLYNVCLIVPDFEYSAKWAAEHGLSAKTPEELAKSPQLHARIGEELEKYSTEFKNYEKPKKWALLSEDFTTENDLLTPKMSVKRRNVLTRYLPIIDSLYG